MTFIRETTNYNKTKTGKLMQDFVVRDSEGLTKGIYTHWSNADDEVFAKGEYEVSSYDLNLRSNGGFTNLVMTVKGFKKVK